MAGIQDGALRLSAWLLGLLLALGGGLWSPSTFAADRSVATETSSTGHSVVVPAAVEVPPPPTDFLQYEGGWLNIAYPVDAKGVVEPLIEEASRFRQSLRKTLGHPVLDSKIFVRVAQDPDEMKLLAPKGAPYPRYAAGVAYSSLRLILLTVEPLFPNSDHKLKEVFRHELVHLALPEAVGGAGRIPTWLNEGLAVHLSGEGSLRRIQSLTMAVLSNRVFPLRQLARGFPNDTVQTPIAYAQSADVVRKLLRREELPRFTSMLGRIRKGQSFSSAMQDAYGLVPYGLGSNSLEHEWKVEVANRYSFWPMLGGSFLWTGVLGLVVVGYRRRRRRHVATLERWALEEAALEQAEALKRATQGAIQIVVTSAPASGATEKEPTQSIANGSVAGKLKSPVDVPRVEHDGNWHTLH